MFHFWGFEAIGTRKPWLYVLQKPLICFWIAPFEPLICTQSFLKHVKIKTPMQDPKEIFYYNFYTIVKYIFVLLALAGHLLIFLKWFLLGVENKIETLADFKNKVGKQS
ncbi:hypothetical protein E2320_001519 [Naja naja]|nr:hypothetical protein E2320_001519 [Naja naja]